MKELQSLGLDVKILDANHEEIEMRELEDDDFVQNEPKQPESETKESEKVGATES